MGPKGANIPIMANSMVLDIKKLVMPDGKNANYAPLEKAMDEFKDCGFNGFIAKIDADPNNNYKNSLLTEVLSKAESRNMFVIIFGSAFSVPSDTELSDLNKTASTKATDDEKIQVYTDYYILRVTKFIEACSDYESFGGVHLKDEPTLTQLQDRYTADSGQTIANFKTAIGSYYCLSNRYAIIKSLLPENAVLMVNLTGVQDSTKHIDIEGKTYLSYLDAYYNIEGNNSNSHPYLWSFDIYPITEHNYLLERNFYLAINSKDVDSVKLNQNGEVEVNYKFFYDDLKLFNEYSSGSNGIFWSYVQGMSFMGARFFHPLSQEQYLRFAAFSALAMGAQGILCWTYHQRGNEPQELYLSAPIDRQDRKTPVWYYAKKVIAEIRHFNNVFRGSKLLGYGHMINLYDTGQALKFPFGRLNGIRPFGDGYLVTRLRQGSSTEYVVVVNHSVRDYQEITLFFSSGTTILEMTPEGKAYGEPQAITVSSSGVNRILPPGGYLIYKYTV